MLFLFYKFTEMFTKKKAALFPENSPPTPEIKSVSADKCRANTAGRICGELISASIQAPKRRRTKTKGFIMIQAARRGVGAARRRGGTRPALVHAGSDSRGFEDPLPVTGSGGHFLADSAETNLRIKQGWQTRAGTLSQSQHFQKRKHEYLQFSCEPSVGRTCTQVAAPLWANRHCCWWQRPSWFARPSACQVLTLRKGNKTFRTSGLYQTCCSSRKEGGRKRRLLHVSHHMNPEISSTSTQKRNSHAL